MVTANLSLFQAVCLHGSFSCRSCLTWGWGCFAVRGELLTWLWTASGPQVLLGTSHFSIRVSRDVLVSSTNSCFKPYSGKRLEIGRHQFLCAVVNICCDTCGVTRARRETGCVLGNDERELCATGFRNSTNNSLMLFFFFPLQRC